MASPVIESNADPVKKAPEVPEFDDDAAAGDWGLYQRRCAFVEASPIIDAADTIALKRRFGLAYLGGRAQLHGGVYLRTRPSVFTPAFIDQLAQQNCSKRFARYPWLERLLQLWQQLDQDQYLSTPIQGTITLPPKRRQRLQVVPNTGL